MRHPPESPILQMLVRSFSRGRGASAQGSRPIRAAEVAWRITRVCAVGIESRAAGWCLGPIRPEDLEFSGIELRRVPHRGAAAERRARRSGIAHQRAGHGSGCRLLGIPEDALRALIERWSPIGCAEYLTEAIGEAIAELGRTVPTDGWSREAASEAVESALSDRIIILPPGESDVLEGRS